MALAAPVALIVAVVLVGNLTALPHVEAWDDTLYPQEIPSIFHIPSPEPLNGISEPPTPVWTTPIRGGSMGSIDVIGGDSAIVMLRFDTYLLGIDMRTGKQRWPFIDLREAPTSCAVREDRIGCVSPASSGADSTVLLLDAASGKIVKMAKVLNRKLRSITVSGDRFIAMTDSSDTKGFAVGYTTQGEQVWTREGSPFMYVSASEGILVDGARNADEVVFVSAVDGRELLRSTRVSTKRDLVWNVFDGGIAIQNQDWTGTDIYNLRGKKESSVAGWEPVGYQSPYAATSPLPLLTRLEASSYPDENTIAAPNPMTGHLLWRISEPHSPDEIATAGDQLIVGLADPDGPHDSTGQEFFRVYNCITGEPSSPPINLNRKSSSSVEPYWIKLDGYQLVYTYSDSRSPLPYVMVGYDISSGKRNWELPMASQPGYPGGRIVAASSSEAVSLFG